MKRATRFQKTPGVRHSRAHTAEKYCRLADYAHLHRAIRNADEQTIHHLNELRDSFDAQDDGRE